MKKNSTSIIILCVALCVIFSGCSNSVSPKTMQQEIENAWNTNDEYDSNSFMYDLEQSASFTVKKIKKEKKNCYSVTLEVTSANALDGLKQYQSSITAMPTNEEMNEKIKEIIQNSAPQTTEQTLMVFKTDEGFSVVFTDKFIDAMCGYCYSYCMNEMHSILEGEEK